MRERVHKNNTDYVEMKGYGEKFLPHFCNDKFQMRANSNEGMDDVKCRKISNNIISRYITKRAYVDLLRN